MSNLENKINDFTDLEAWKRGHDLVLEIYKVTKDFPKEEKYGVIDQLRRAASSITANIAEGFARYHFNDKARFYYQARGSAAEVKNFLLLAKDLNFTNQENCNYLCDKTDKVRQLINGLIRSIESQKHDTKNS